MASRTYRAEAIVLRTVDLGEADRILVLFTRHFGKVHVVAKGIRRTTSRMAGHAEPLTHATYQLARGRELDVLTGAEARAIYPALREDLGRIAAGWYCAELIDRFTVERAPARRCSTCSRRRCGISTPATPRHWCAAGSTCTSSTAPGSAPSSRRASRAGTRSRSG